MATDYVINPSDVTKPSDDDWAKKAAGELRAIKGKVNQLASAAVLPVVPLLNQSSLTQLLYPSEDGNWRDVYRAGWKPFSFNQQWGGAQFGTEMIDGATGNTYKFDVATGNVQDDNFSSVSAAGANTYAYEGVKTGETITLNAVWLKVYKVGNPANNLTLRILLDDGTGTKPTLNVPIANGTATAQSGKLHTSKSDGEWYRFVFAVAPTLNANTFYHLVLSSSGAVDGTNYWAWKKTLISKYPFGGSGFGDATPTWALNSATQTHCFLLESAAATQFFQPAAGQFDSAFKFLEGTPYNQSKALTQPLRNFLDGKLFTARQVVTNPVAGKGIADYVYGLDHDRISLTCETGTGFACLRIYDSAGTVTAVTGNTNIAGSGPHDISIIVRTKGDGADYAQLWVDGTKQAEVTIKTFAMDAAFRDYGVAILGGCFPTTPAWTQNMLMTSLPSAQGWTYSGSATEANVFSIQNGKLKQNKNGYASTDSGYYQKSALGLVNATGWTLAWKGKVNNNTNDPGAFGSSVIINDGTKGLSIIIAEYFVQTVSASTDATVQGDFKSQDNTFVLTGKGSDYYLHINGKLAIDGTGKLTLAAASNSILFGDGTGNASENADATWSYVKYYTGGMLNPLIATGMYLHEYAHWSGDRSSLVPTLYNSGTLYSTKQICGVRENYVNRQQRYKELRRGITGSPTAGAAMTTIPELEHFFLGSDFDAKFQTLAQNNTAGQPADCWVFMDGAQFSDGRSYYTSVSAGTPGTVTGSLVRTGLNLGMHKLEVRGSGGGAAVTFNNNNRNMSTDIGYD